MLTRKNAVGEDTVAQLQQDVDHAHAGDPPHKRLKLTDQHAAITTQQADVETALEVDLLILDHLAYQTTQAALATRSESANSSSPGRLLSAFDAFHSTFRARHPRYEPDSELRFRILLLKLVVLYTQRLTRNPSTPSLEGLTVLRQTNRERAERWSQGMGEELLEHVSPSPTPVPETPKKKLNLCSKGLNTALPDSTRSVKSATFTWEEDNILLDGTRLKLSINQILDRFDGRLHHTASACRARRRELLHKYGGQTAVRETLSQMPKDEGESEDEPMLDAPILSHVSSPHPNHLQSTTLIAPFPNSPHFHCLASSHPSLDPADLETNRAATLAALSAPAETLADPPFFGTPFSPALLDLLPLFMQVSALRNRIGNSNPTPQWMQLASSFMLWACLEAELIRGPNENEHELEIRGAALYREAFFWGHRSPLPPGATDEDALINEMFTADFDADSSSPIPPSEVPTWQSIKTATLRLLLEPLSTNPLRLEPSSAELLNRLRAAADSCPLKDFEDAILRFLQALAGSLDLPVLLQLEGGALKGMSGEETREFLRGCGLGEGWGVW
ncbi:hypothetical protein MBLNU230_g3584t1 [Neophaeotheca triangularis]